MIQRRQDGPRSRLDRLKALFALAALLCVGLLTAAPAGATTLPPEFEEITLATGLDEPVAVTFAPDGRMFVAEKKGRVRVIAADGSLVAQPLIDISGHVNAHSDRGLLSIATDKDFAINGYLYLLYVYEHNPSDPDGPKTSRLTRVTVAPDNSVSPEVTILGSLTTAPCPPPANNVHCIPAEFHTHAIGTVRSDPSDGTLWVGSGDGTNHPPNDTGLRTYNEQSYAGKVLHVDRNGQGLPGHPFCPTQNDLSAVCTKIYAKGFRNPFRFTLRAGAGPVLGDVGFNSREEINLLRPGGDYGWPCYEGSIRQPAFSGDLRCDFEYAKEGTADAAIPPVYECAHNACSALIAGPTYTGGPYPGDFDGDIFIADYAAGFIKRLKVDGAGNFVSVTSFAGETFGAVDVELAPNGDLVWVDIGFSPNSGTLREIRFAGANRTPVAHAQADPSFGATPLTVAFRGDTSTDPDGDALTYSWDFGDGTTSSAANPSHVYLDGSRNYTVTLTVSDGRGGSDSDTLTVYPGNTPPSVTLNAPATFRAGAPVTLTGSASDPEDGQLAGSQLSWVVKLKHASHLHPLGESTGTQFSFTAHDDHDADSHYEVTLTARDSRGMEVTKTATINPETRLLTIDSVPQGAPVTYDGRSEVTPYSTQAAVGFKTSLSAPTRFNLGGRVYQFESWSDGGAAQHAITVPDADTSLVARYRELTLHALLIVKNAGALGGGDLAVKNRLEANDWDVVVRSENAAASEATGKDLVIISSTVVASALGSRFRDVAAPVMTWEGGIYDDLGLTGSAGSFNGTASKTGLTITDPSHPLAAGETGTPTLTTQLATFRWGRAGAEAARVATVPGDSTRTSIFGYETGANMPGAVAPARRIAFYFDDATPTVLTEAGWRLFDAAVVWGAGSSAPPPPPPPPSGGAILFVVGSPLLNAGDQAIVNRLTGSGYSVTTVDDGLSTGSDATGKAAVLISSTVSASTVGSRFRDVAVPVVMWEGSIYDDMGLTTAAGSFNGTSTTNSVAIVDATHPLAAGLTGTPAVTASNMPLRWGRAGTASIKAATIPGDAGRAASFGYNQGAPLSGLTAPARRVGLFLGDDTATSLTSDGWRLVDAAVSWAAAG